MLYNFWSEISFTYNTTVDNQQTRNIHFNVPNVKQEQEKSMLYCDRMLYGKYIQ